MVLKIEFRVWGWGFGAQGLGVEFEAQGAGSKSTCVETRKTIIQVADLTKRTAAAEQKHQLKCQTLTRMPDILHVTSVV